MKDGGKVTVADYSGGVSFSTGKYEGKRFTMRPDANTSYWDDKIFEKCRDDGHVKLKLSGTVEGKSASGSTYAECTPQSQWTKVDCDDIAADAAAPSATPVDTPAPSVTAAPTGSSAIAACGYIGQQLCVHRGNGECCPKAKSVNRRHSTSDRHEILQLLFAWPHFFAR